MWRPWLGVISNSVSTNRMALGAMMPRPLPSVGLRLQAIFSFDTAFMRLNCSMEGK